MPRWSTKPEDYGARGDQRVFRALERTIFDRLGLRPPDADLLPLR